MPVKNQKRTIGIALGGGGARGFAHVGVLKALEQAGIHIEVIVGTSMGAIVGGLYAQLGTVSKVIDRLQLVLKEQKSNARDLNVFPENQKGDHFFEHVAKELKQRIIINLSISRKSLLSAERIERAVRSLIDDCLIEELPITFAAMASDLNSGSGVILNSGSLVRAIIASASIPGFFPPVKWGDHLLVDGEATDLIPVEACFSLGADFVIAVDVRRKLNPQVELRHTIDVFIRTARITNYRYADTELQKADFAFRPALGDDIQWSEFERLNDLIAAGEKSAIDQMPKLLKSLQKKKFFWQNIWKKELPDEKFSKSHIQMVSTTVK